MNLWFKSRNWQREHSRYQASTSLFQRIFKQSMMIIMSTKHENAPKPSSHFTCVVVNHIPWSSDLIINPSNPLAYSLLDFTYNMNSVPLRNRARVHVEYPGYLRYHSPKSGRRRQIPQYSVRHVVSRALLWSTVVYFAWHC